MQHFGEVGGIARGGHCIDVAQVLPLVIDEQPVVLVHIERALRICAQMECLFVKSCLTLPSFE